MTDILARLTHARTTAMNDDISEPMGEKRRRHMARLDTMEDAEAEIASLRAQLAELTRERDEARDERRALRLVLTMAHTVVAHHDWDAQIPTTAVGQLAQALGRLSQAAGPSVSDLVERLRASEGDAMMAAHPTPLELEAADEIERLRSENERLTGRVAEHEAVWNDSAAMHVNLLRARILSRDQALHLAGATDYDSLRARVAELEGENERLAKLVYVPGLRKCAKCGFVLVTSNLHAHTGAVTANDKAGTCPNCNVPLWRVTERDAGNDMVDRATEQVARAVAAEKRVSELEGENERLRSENERLMRDGLEAIAAMQRVASAAEAEVTKLRAAIEAALAVDSQVGETADGKMIDILQAALSQAADKEMAEE
jgi:hypothetical protein